MTGAAPIRLVMVDDHEVLRQGLQFMLRDEPDVEIVGEAGDGLAGLRRIAELGPDVVLLDLQMPDLDGLATLRRLRRLEDAPYVIVFTVNDDPEYVEAALAAGADGYLLKSVDRDELLRALRAVRDGNGYIQAEVTRPVLRRLLRAPVRPVETDLTSREVEVLELMARGLANKQIAIELGIAEATVKGYLRELYPKLGAADRAHAVALALRSRLIE